MDDNTKSVELPDAQGHFGPFGGKYVIETLMPALDSLERLYEEVRNDPKFQSDLKYYLKEVLDKPIDKRNHQRRNRSCSLPPTRLDAN